MWVGVHAGTHKLKKSEQLHALTFVCNGADEETRTLDPRITSAVLYQLSYIGTRVSRVV